MSTPTLAGSCEHCHNGYRTDFMAIDHYGEDTPETRACAAEEAPCPAHECYWADRHGTELFHGGDRVIALGQRPWSRDVVGTVAHYVGGGDYWVIVDSGNGMTVPGPALRRAVSLVKDHHTDRYAGEWTRLSRRQAHRDAADLDRQRVARRNGTATIDYRRRPPVQPVNLRKATGRRYAVGSPVEYVATWGTWARGTVAYSSGTGSVIIAAPTSPTGVDYAMPEFVRAYR